MTTVDIPCVCEGLNPGCGLCGGAGHVAKPACRRCAGKGTQGGVKCLDCRGAGWRSLDLDAFVDPKYIGPSIGGY